MSDRAREVETRLLIVDDTEANRYAVARHLRANGFTVREAATGRDALAEVERETPDMIVLDIRLPDISGLELARRLREDPRTAGIPILHISASFTDSVSLARGLDNGADGYLTHPVDPLVLLATIRGLFRARAAEREAFAMARDWRSTFDAIGEGVCVTDSTGLITRCNRAFLSLVGGGSQEASSYISELIPGVTILPEAPYLQLPGGGNAARIESGDRWLRVSSMPVTGTDGEEPGVVCVVTDITRERRADERARLAMQLESTGRLAGGVAHEINNMMTVILANAEFALRGLPPGDPVRADIESIHQAAARSAEVARQLLTFSRRQVVRPRIVDVHALLRKSEGMIRRLLGADRPLRLRLGATDAWINVDPLGLEQVVINLALNARDAMPHGGELIISTSNVQLGEEMARRHPEIAIRHGRYVQVAVQDTGLGMDRGTLDRIFEPFFTTKRVGEGTGLGLATVFGMVKQSDGYIWADSEVGHGSVFTIQLPQAVPSAAEMAAPPLSGRDKGQGAILLVEDEPMVQSLLSRALVEAGYRAEVAADGDEALNVLERLEGNVAAVLSDVVMPGMGGRELAEMLRKRWPDIPILFMSGYTNEEIIHRGLLGPDEPFLQKPFPPAALAAALAGLLQRGTARDQEFEVGSG
ncbi:MAG TPA: response regulator [Gemmatimonadales bacterium]|nr:response regulator [Gemmatimonadales bacterium]